MTARPWTTAGGRLQKSRSSLWGLDRQLSMISNLQGGTHGLTARCMTPSLRDTKRNPTAAIAAL